MKGKNQSGADSERERSSSTPRSETNDENSHPLMSLQAQIGNRAVTDLISDEGSPVPAEVRGPIESSMGRGFSQVRIHEGKEVDEVGAKIDAPAFAAGTDIFLRSDAPPLDSPMGQLMIGEELAHVAQGVGTGEVEGITSPGETLEHQAREAGIAAASGEKALVSAARQPSRDLARFDPKAVWEDLKDRWPLGDKEKAEKVAPGKEGDKEPPKEEPEKEPEKEPPKEKEEIVSPLSPAQKATLRSAIPPIEAALAGIKTSKLDKLADSLLAPSMALHAFDVPEEAVPAMIDARDNMFGAIQVLQVASDPESARKSMAQEFSGMQKKVLGYLAGQRPATTAPPGGVAPAATALTPEEARDVVPAEMALSFAAKELAKEQPDYSLVKGNLQLASKSLNNAAGPEKIKGDFAGMAIAIEFRLTEVEALMQGEKLEEYARQEAESKLRTVLEIVGALSADKIVVEGKVSTGTPEEPAVPATGGV